MTNQIIEGDALTVLKTLPDKIVQTCITSPPYWGLRSYKTEPQVWGGRDDCEHEWGNEKIASNSGGGWNDPEKRINYPTMRLRNPAKESQAKVSQGNFCCLCSAWRGELGLEPTIELYVQHIVEIFNELRRILRDDGTLWLNMGDSYATSPAGNKPNTTALSSGLPNSIENQEMRRSAQCKKKDYSGLKPKDLCGIPWRVAFALQADGWWLRSDLPQKQLWVCPCGCGYAMILYRQWDGDIIWEKQNPMPESCTDRPTRSHEYIFLLTKSGTSQYWTHRDLNGTRKRPQADYRWIDEITKKETDVKPDGWTIKNKMGWDRLNLWQGHDYYYDADAVREPSVRPGEVGDLGSKKGRNWEIPSDDPNYRGEKGSQWGKPITTGANRNLRTVWTFATQPFPEAHFATFPEELVRRCILAGTAEQACPTCGAAWERVIEKGDLVGQDRGGNYDGREIDQMVRKNPGTPGLQYENKTLGFRPTCKCENNDGSGRCIALDPFGGSGTVALVALKHGRDHLTIELKPEYIKMIEKRLKPLGNKPCPQQVEII